MKKLKSSCGFLAGGISLLAIHSAQAQEAPPQETASASSGDIVVTARRRSEGISRVPTTVSALGAESLAQRSISSQSDLQASVPGLLVRETQSNNQLNYSIRGQTVDAFSGSATAVVPYVNEVPVIAGGIASFFDLESIQVLKGPQGTLFGRNATGGAVLSQTARPKEEFGGNVRVGYGNLDAIDAEGAINVPLVGDQVLFRGAFKLARRDGYIDNVYTGPVFGGGDNSELGRLNDTAGRASLLLTNLGGFENLTVFQYERTKGNNSGSRLYSYNQCGQGRDGSQLNCAAFSLFGPQLDAIYGPGAWASVLAANPGYDPNGIQGVLARQNNELGFWEVNGAAPSFHRATDWFVTNNTTYELGNDTVIKNVFGYTASKAADATIQSGTPYILITNFDVSRPATPGFPNIGNRVVNKSVSEELQLQGKLLAGGLDYVVGGYYQRVTNHTILPQSYFGLAPIQPPAGTTSNFRSVDTTQALFAHGTFDLGILAGLDGLKFSIGGRYAWEKVTLDHLEGGAFYGLTTPDAKFDRASWNLGLEYQATKELMFYLVARESWRGGGINGVAPPSLGTTFTNTDKFKPEVAQDFEAGAKFNGYVGGSQAHLYVSAYTMKVKNIQRGLFPSNPLDPSLGAIAVTVNVPEARIKGVELDAGIRPTDWLDLGINGAYTDGKFTKNLALPFGVPVRFGPMADTPEWTASAYAVVTLPVPETIGNARLRGDVYTQSSFYFSNTEYSISPGTKLPSYTLANFRFDLDNIAQTNFGASLWIKNAFNEKYYVGGVSLGGSLGMNAANVGRPQMYGVELRYSF